MKLLTTHRSDRSFTDQPISDSDLDQIIEAGYRSPTSNNSQTVSVVVVKDQKARERLAAIAGGQTHVAKAPVFIAVVIDYHKTEIGLELAGKKQQSHLSLEGTLVGATDAGIALQSMNVAANSLGLGAVAIGGIRRNSLEVIKLLGLPLHTFPLVGLAVGHIDKPAVQRPRLPLSTFRHNERYSSEGLQESIAQYNQTLLDHWKKVGRNDGLSWSESVGSYFDHNYRPEVSSVFKLQDLDTL
jgi:FMN reductase [NAD(P)H]